MRISLMAATLLLWSGSDASGQEQQLRTSEARATDTYLGASLGRYHFLSGTNLGASGHFLILGRSPWGGHINAWVTRMAVGVDGGGLLAGVWDGGAVYLKGGGGLLINFINAREGGPGIHAGIGGLFGSGRVALLMEVTARMYVPEGGVPVASIAAGIVKR